MNLTQEQIDFLNEAVYGTWKQTSDGVVAKGMVQMPKKDLKQIPAQFYKVGGYFDCSGNQLRTLEGAPEGVGGSFYCFRNQLQTLEGAPREVDDYFDCSGNQLRNLEGAPRMVYGSFECYNNQLRNLEGAPRMVYGSFECYNNQLRNLEGAPREVGYSNNPIYTKHVIEDKIEEPKEIEPLIKYAIRL